MKIIRFNPIEVTKDLDKVLLTFGRKGIVFEDEYRSRIVLDHSPLVLEYDLYLDAVSLKSPRSCNHISVLCGHDENNGLLRSKVFTSPVVAQAIKNELGISNNSTDCNSSEFATDTDNNESVKDTMLTLDKLLRLGEVTKGLSDSEKRIKYEKDINYALDTCNKGLFTKVVEQMEQEGITL